MKKLFAFVASMALMMAFAACSDENDLGSNENGNQGDGQDGQILVMFYGAGGETLDGGITGNILQSLNAGSSDKVKITYEYRFSQAYQQVDAKFKNILRFTADQNKQFVDNVNIDSTLSESFSIGTFVNNINCTHIGDENYVMASDTALTTFINWSKQQYPNAKKTVLILSDHGSGWGFALDGYPDYETRSILHDDNIYGSHLSAGAVKKGILNAGGKVDLIYTDACLMSTWENLTCYANAANYFLGSLEVAPGIGGNYDFLIRGLKNAEVTDEGLYEATKTYVDNVINNWWEKYSEKNPNDPVYGDLAVYDLRKIDEPLNVMTDIRKALVERYNDATEIAGLTDKTMGTTWKDYIDCGISGCLVATSVYPGYVAESMLPQAMKDSIEKNRQEYLNRFDIYYQKVNEQGQVGYLGQIVVELLKQTDAKQLVSGADAQKYFELWDELSNQTTDSYPVTDFLDEIQYFLSEAGSKDSTLAALNDRYINALHDFGYINCTKPILLPKYTAAYMFCSPGVTLFPLNKEGFENKNNFSQRISSAINTPEEAIMYYEATDFDQKVKWCELLKIIDRAPDMIGNPCREEIKENLE